MSNDYREQKIANRFLAQKICGKKSYFRCKTNQKIKEKQNKMNNGALVTTCIKQINYKLPSKSP